LNALPSDDRQEEWFPGLAALNSLEPEWGDAARLIAIWWSKKSVKFDQADFDRNWESLDPAKPGGITIESLF
jgi:Primase C terminal 2 (PriCT-2)